MTQSCICYTPDPGYLFPTLVSAIQARRHCPAEVADVMIFLIGDPCDADRTLAPICEAEGIGYMSVSRDRIEGADAMMSRLYLDRFVPGHYAQLLYIDGDTQVIGGLEPLLTADVPPGHFMAAKDPIAFSIPDDDPASSRESQYFQSIGLPAMQRQDYFNSGVLRINRDGWEEIGRVAQQWYSTIRDRTRFPDQDALNIAGKGRHIPMSLAWNFPVFLRNAGVEQLLQPRIVHYMARPKPWQGGFLPWGRSGRQPYLDVIRKYPQLLPLSERLPRLLKMKYHGQQQYKWVSERLTWRRGFRKEAMVAYESGIRL